MRIKLFFPSALIILLFLLNNNLPAANQTERILDYKSDITVYRDGSMTVTETIKVISKGDQIKRGIYRTFPTKYKDRYGFNVRISFKVNQVLKNGMVEPFHTESFSNGVKVYIGSKNAFLNPGEYTYSITYTTDRQIGFFEEFDELYWNVTGNDWGFAIDKAEAIVKLPNGASIIESDAYTGFEGDKGKDFRMGEDRSGNIKFITTRVLNPNECLTIVVTWPKGIIPEPTFEDKVSNSFQDYPSTLAAILGMLVLLVYYLAAWLKVGKDPEKGTIFPLFKPPVRFSPAAVRFMMKMGYSDKVFAAAIVNMAVKGYVKITENNGDFTLTKTGSNESVLSKGEKKIAHKLFSSRNSIKFKQKNHVKIRASITALKKSLKVDFEKIYFYTNSNYIIPGIILTVLTLAAVVLSASEKMGALFMTIWLSGWTTGCFFLVKSAIMAWKAALSSGGGKGALKKGGAMGLTLFSLPFLIGEIVGLTAFSFFASPITVVIFLVIIAINILFYQLLKAPTLYGRRFMDQIEGFKMYLEVAEEDRLIVLHSPNKTPELFEKYLPYAMALDVENAWSEKFSDVLAKASQDTGYTPGWYSGRNWSSLGTTGLASSLGSSFSSAISSSSTAPGSSSGSGGGGSSGGGGGGGGGGGW
ncbi:DUF2207 domain-containing protein [candidate division KSB1 bacterium]|nr:DUF2207 domain-containing protein [candidate division KSB1 bacterium]